MIAGVVDKLLYRGRKRRREGTTFVELNEYINANKSAFLTLNIDKSVEETLSL